MLEEAVYDHLRGYARVEGALGQGAGVVLVEHTGHRATRGRKQPATRTVHTLNYDLT